MSVKSYRLVAIDLDGTLLNSSHELTDFTISTLRELNKQGLIICIATGRSVPAVLHILDKLSLPSTHVPCVVFNGGAGVVYTQGTTKTLYTNPLAAEHVDKTLMLARRLGLCAQYYFENEIYVRCSDESQRGLVGKYAALTGATHTHVDQYQEARVRGLPPKILILTETPQLDVLYEAAKEEVGGDLHLIRGAPPFFCEFLRPGVNKGFGLGQMCERLGIPLEEVVAFGDADNDLEMLRSVGCGVAMKNARDVAKRAANRVTEFTNDQDGVARTLLQMLEDGEFNVRGEIVSLQAISKI